MRSGKEENQAANVRIEINIYLLPYTPTASGRVRSGKEVSCEYENIGKSLYYISTASGRVRSGKQVSCE